MCDTKYLNKYNKLQHLAKYLGKSFLMENNPPKRFFPLSKPCLNVNYNFIIVTGGKLISSNVFLSSLILNIKKKMLPYTTVVIRLHL